MIIKLYYLYIINLKLFKFLFLYYYYGILRINFCGEFYVYLVSIGKIKYWFFLK